MRLGDDCCARLNAAFYRKRDSFELLVYWQVGWRKTSSLWSCGRRVECVGRVRADGLAAGHEIEAYSVPVTTRPTKMLRRLSQANAARQVSAKASAEQRKKSSQQSSDLADSKLEFMGTLSARDHQAGEPKRKPVAAWLGLPLPGRSVRIRTKSAKRRRL